MRQTLYLVHAVPVGAEMRDTLSMPRDGALFFDSPWPGWMSIRAKGRDDITVPASNVRCIAAHREAEPENPPTPPKPKRGRRR